MPKEISIWWLRRDLRLVDNAALYHALAGKYPVLPVFIFDKVILEKLPAKKDKRIVFIYHALQEIKDELQKNGSSLYALHDIPLNAFKKICKDFDVKEVFTNHDYEPYAIERDNAIKNFLADQNIVFNTYKDQVIFEKIGRTEKRRYALYRFYHLFKRLEKKVCGTRAINFCHRKTFFKPVAG